METSLEYLGVVSEGLRWTSNPSPAQLAQFRLVDSPICLVWGSSIDLSKSITTHSENRNIRDKNGSRLSQLVGRMGFPTAEPRYLWLSR